MLVDGGIEGPALSLFTNSMYDMISSMVSTFLSALCLFILAPKFNTPPHMRLYIVVLLKFARYLKWYCTFSYSIIGDIFAANTDINGHLRLIAIDIAIVLRVLEVIFLFILLLKARREHRLLKSKLFH